ncbi:unnamed protein product (macronuclear) [Paramecium tetraurelia]|uniref:H-type lectin domain-containing protein n=1 Tax=Paramecium tetraurelia TaxID=5888 RepID=A0D9U8_PARTE|nr:uncharacterized protein GSPATT00014746001 [Paramecium tetraurelia]CAK79815.1 unnamed protein product [Paramecium tetraurelia]|eukprot:XP_001447212.1 hypothetical protein (macronuclear) [Paramecium tetraurelia strain d4-2]
MKTIIIITLIFVCLSQNANVTRELEIGVIQFEEAKGSQIYNQLVRFDTPFAKPPQVALALVEHTSTTALFAKVKNITQHDFIIQFFSAVTLNATYRYLATTDEDVYINCSNYRATQQAIFRYPQFQSNVEAMAFLVGYHHNGFVNISIDQSNNLAKLQINTNDVQQTAIGMCLIVGSNLKFDDEADTPKFSGRVSSQGQTRSLSFIASILKILFIEVQQSSEQTKEKNRETLTDLKTFLDKETQVQVPSQSSEQFIEVPEAEQINDHNLNQLDAQEVSESQDEDEIQELEQEIKDDIIEEESSDYDDNSEEDDEYFWSSKDNVDFELQLTLLQDALKKKPQIQQQTIKELIKKAPSNQKEQKQKQIIKKQKETTQNQSNNQPIEQTNYTKETLNTQILNNEEIDMQLQQKESHVRSLKKALKLVDTVKEKELEIIFPQIENQKESSQGQQLNDVKADNKIQENPQESKAIGYKSPLIDDIPKVEEIIQVKQKEKKFTQKLDGYMQSFSQDTYTQKVQKKREVDQIKQIESIEKETIQQEQAQLIQLKGQSHSAKVVYEASEDSLRKFEEDFERRKYRGKNEGNQITINSREQANQSQIFIISLRGRIAEIIQRFLLQLNIINQTQYNNFLQLVSFSYLELFLYFVNIEEFQEPHQNFKQYLEY